MLDFIHPFCRLYLSLSPGKQLRIYLRLCLAQLPPLAPRDFSILESEGVKEQTYGRSDLVSRVK